MLFPWLLLIIALVGVGGLVLVIAVFVREMRIFFYPGLLLTVSGLLIFVYRYWPLYEAIGCLILVGVLVYVGLSRTATAKKV